MMRGRHTLAILKRAGVEDTIAPTLEAYVQLAADLGQNESLRAEITEKIVASHAQLYDNLESVRGLEEFLNKSLINSDY